MQQHDYGLAPLDPIKPARVSRDLRTGTGAYLSKRRGVFCLSLTAAASMGVISLYQMGVLRHLPEPPLPHLDADKVDASRQSFEWLSTPDGPLGLLSYSATAVLAAAGGKDRATRTPWIPIALAAKVAADTAQAARLTIDQWTKHRAFCSYCLLAAGATFATVPLVVPEVMDALRELLGKSMRTHT
ncbi:MAG TPA: vitamin K epoxide reductase family protein [Rhodothermales bacterium]|nr:vitamin K epoxide reductase family protein [Rhodothermales bacterium]